MFPSRAHLKGVCPVYNKKCDICGAIEHFRVCKQCFQHKQQQQSLMTNEQVSQIQERLTVPNEHTLKPIAGFGMNDIWINCIDTFVKRTYH